MQLLKEKAEATELAIDQRMFTLNDGCEGKPAMRETPADSASALYQLARIGDRTGDGLRVDQSYFDSSIPSKDLKAWDRFARWYEHKVNLAHTLFFRAARKPRHAGYSEHRALGQYVFLCPRAKNIHPGHPPPLVKILCGQAGYLNGKATS